MKVSVIMPCYNQGRFLADAVDSVLAQNCEDVEIIVVDDGSQDETPEVAASLGPKIRYIRKQNAGPSAARNSGILHSSGEFLLFLDGDDYLMPGMLPRMLEAAAHTPDAAIYYGTCRFVDAQGVLMHYVPTPVHFEDALHGLQKGNPFPIHSILVRRSALAEVGLFDPLMRSCEDWDLWLRVAGWGGKFAHVPNAEVAYRRYANTLSTRSLVMLQTAIAVLGRSRIYHSRCPQCRASIRIGIRSQSENRFHEWFSYCFHQDSDERARKMGSIMKTMYANPTLALPFLKFIRHKIARKVIPRNLLPRHA